MMILIWVGIGILVVWGLRAFSLDGVAPQRRQQRDPQEIAAQRYARGEITRDEYLTLLDDLAIEYENTDVFNKQKRSN